MDINIKQIFGSLITDVIPQKATNIFYQLFNGIQAGLDLIDTKLTTYKRERNILTATSLHSLRNLASQNGYEPCLIIPSKGVLHLNISTKLFTRCGYPLYVKPYAVFKCKTTKVSYIYNGRKTIKIESNSTMIPVTQGVIDTMTVTGTGEVVQRIYLKESMVAENSIVVNVVTSSGIEPLQEVLSFFDNEGMFNDRQFIVKHSSDIQFPIIIYVKGVKFNQQIDISYFTSVGEDGNLSTKMLFESDDIVDNFGVRVDGSDDEIEIYNAYGFNFGSNGTDENSLRAALGFNHGSQLLFDVASYQSFMYKYSTILLQRIEPSTKHKSIINLYLTKKCDLNITNDADLTTVSEAYQRIVNNRMYMLSQQELTSINDIINEYEYGLTSHNLFDPITNKYAIQIIFDNIDELELHKNDVGVLIYKLFVPFFYNNNYVLNLDDKLTDYMDEHNTKFEYNVFSEQLELTKIKIMTGELIATDIDDSNWTKISSKDHLPLLANGFDVIDTSGDTLTKEIFTIPFDINIISK
jgi:hypothetical protein